MYAKVTAHKTFLVCELLADGDVPDAVASTIDNPGRFGQVIMGTADHLGVSEEALALMTQIPRGRDAIGDIDWWATTDGKAAFGWIGGPKALINASNAEGSRNYVVMRDQCKIIPNDVPAEAMAVIDQ